jgi:hypothetical protein
MENEKIAITNKTLPKQGKSARFCKMHELVPRAVKSARYPAFLEKARTFDKTDQN